MITSTETLMQTLQRQIDNIEKDPKHNAQGRSIAYIAGKMIYLAGANIRYNLMMARKTPIAFFEQPKQLRAVAARKTNTKARVSVKLPPPIY